MVCNVLDVRHIKHKQLCLARSGNKSFINLLDNNIRTVEAGITEAKGFHLQCHWFES